MRKQKRYLNVRFKPQIIHEAWTTLTDHIENDEKLRRYNEYSVEVDGEKWYHDTEEEFFADYRRSSSYAYFSKHLGNLDIDIHAYSGRTTVAITAPKRAIIENVFHVFESHVAESEVPEQNRVEPVVFIGHGRNSQWRDLKDHLHEKHNIEVEAYEVGAHAGHAIRDVLEDMMAKSSFALLVMTSEDKTDEGMYRARQNVIHEAGLFQCKLGFSKAIVVIEEGTDDFSNIHGIQQIRYSRDNIKEVFGEVLATLRREFGISAV